MENNYEAEYVGIGECPACGGGEEEIYQVYEVEPGRKSNIDGDYPNGCCWSCWHMSSGAEIMAAVDAADPDAE